MGEGELRALEKALNNRTNKNVSTENLIKMIKFALKNSYLKFNGKIKQQISGAAIILPFLKPVYI